MSIDNKRKVPDDALAADVAFALETETRNSPCPDDEVLAAFIDQRLDETERAVVIQHMAGCNECLHRCAGTYTAVSETKQRVLVKRVSVLATACILLICLYIPFKNRISPTSHVADSYTRIVAFSVDKGLSVENLAIPLPWEEKSGQYGFNSGQTPAEDQKAFLGGMYAGKTFFTSEKTELPDFLKHEQERIDAAWAGTPWSAEFKLGKWCYLMKTITENRIEMNGLFSKKQANYLTGVIETMENRPGMKDNAKAKLALVRMKKLQRHFESIGKQDSGIQKWHTLDREIDILTHLLVF